ncbi:MAG: 3-deoxy-D-manno-octulosonic acid transferase [Phycisphaerae bacterium]|nr:3-deoxy-D-manno-octulosonic acid transferase [Phycisphaerae bacterium]
MGVALDIAYFVGLLLTSPMWLYRMVRHGRYRSDLAQRFGAAPRCYGIQPTLWIHGVSLGEVNAMRGLVDELHVQLPDFRVVISSTTETGMAAAKKHFAPGHKVFRWPLDFTWAVARALRRVRPNLVVLLEGEIWPNFLAACNRKNIPVVVVNGRMSPNKGYPRYKMLGRFAAQLFNRVTAIGVQDEAYAERFVELGMDRGKVHLTGMMKFDSVQVADSLPGQEALRKALGLKPAETLLVAGGTGPGEESILLDVYAKLRETHPALRLAIVPRKPERFDEAARLIASAGFGCARRTEHLDGLGGSLGIDDVILGDTMGELRTFYALGSVVFVGRSLVPMGGSDMIEAAALGKPVCFGPHTFNFPQAEGLLRHGAVQVADASALQNQVNVWLSDSTAADQAGRDVQKYVRSQQGATRRNVELLCHVLGRAPAVAPGDVATDMLKA